MALRARIPGLLRVALACAAAGALVGCDASPGGRPNVLLILVDDLGYGDLGSFGRAESRTPHMDRLAREGVRFTRHYSDSSCAPTRAALLSGRHPSRAGFRPRGRGLPAEWTTLAELLRQEGYATRHLGKWHLGGTGIFGLDASPPSALPSGQGFDHWLGFLESWLLKGPRRAPGSVSLWKYDRAGYPSPWLLGSDATSGVYEGHLTDILTDHAVDFLRAPDGEPWFLNLWYLAPHAPVVAHPRYLARHPDTHEGRYAALIEHLDASIERLLEVLAETGQDERTLIVFLSDNGSPLVDDPTSNAPFVGRKTEYAEGGTRAPLAMRWPGRIPAGVSIDAPVSTLDVYPTVAALVDASPPPDLDGRDLGPLLRGDPLAPRPLFFEQQQPTGGNYYSVLSPDGRFRLVRRGDRRLRLLDLESDPTGATDVHASHPEEVERLTRLYREWRRDTMPTQVRIRPLDPSGRSLVTGDDLQRAPGWGGFTFAIGVWPDPQAPEAPDADPDQVIAYQRDVWELVRTSRNALRLRIAGEELKGRKLRIGACNAVVFTADFRRSILRPGDDRSKLALYLNGAEQETLESQALPDRGDLSLTTRIGLSAADHLAFGGRLGPPVFLNDRVDEESGPAFSVASLSEQVCPAEP